MHFKKIKEEEKTLKNKQQLLPWQSRKGGEMPLSVLIILTSCSQRVTALWVQPKGESDISQASLSSSLLPKMHGESTNQTDEKPK